NLVIENTCQDLLIESEKQLIRTVELQDSTKLLMADQYRLDSLKDHVIKSFSSLNDLNEKLKGTPEYKNYSK
ncbi:hypothetical protein PMAYCL1PPCAC_25699, partial [Pristionchus mayeri]